MASLFCPEEQDTVEILCVFGERRRPLLLMKGDRASKLKSVFCKEFCDVLDSTSTASDLKVFFQIESKQWGGRFVDLGDDIELESNTVVKAVPMKDAVEKGVQLCRKASKPTDEHRSVLSRLFPSRSVCRQEVDASKRFDPTVLTSSLKPKLKNPTMKRTKPYKRWIIVMDNPTVNVPSAGIRRKLKRQGREKKIEFKRSQSKVQIKEIIRHSFSELRLDAPTFWKCDGGNKMEKVDIEGYPDGDQLLSIASKESVYIVEDEVISVNTDSSSHSDSSSDNERVIPEKKRFKLLEPFSKVVDIIADLKKPLSSSLSDSDGMNSCENNPGTAELLGDKKDAESVGSHHAIYNEEQFNTELPFFDSENEALEQRNALIEDQDRAYRESLVADQEKARVALQKEKRIEALTQFRQKVCEKFADQPKSGLLVSMRSQSGQSLKYVFNESCSIKDLYQFGYVHGDVDGSFKMYYLMPRREILYCDTKLSECPEISTSIIVIEASEEGVDPYTWCNECTIDENVTQDEMVPNESHSVDCEKHSRNWASILEKEKMERDSFLASSSSFIAPIAHFINRKDLFEQAIRLFSESTILHESSLSITYEGELGVDDGGVSRDFLSAFWEVTYGKFFDGSTLLRPVLHPNVCLELLPTLGAALSHGYLVTGFLPARVVFPCLVAILKGPHVHVSSAILRSCFVDYLSCVDSKVLDTAMKCTSTFPEPLKSQVKTLFYRYDCREEPTSLNILRLIDQVAHYEFLTKPMASIALMHRGITGEEYVFWREKSVESLYELYTSLLTSPLKVLNMIQEPFFNTMNEDRVFGYLQQFVGNMASGVVQKFLRFVTGSTVAVCPTITIQFNSLSGFARRPIAHTCAAVLELSSSYETYIDFVTEFEKVLAEEYYTWVMDCI